MTRSRSNFGRLCGWGLSGLLLILTGCSSRQFPASPRPVTGDVPVRQERPVYADVGFSLLARPLTKPTGGAGARVEERLISARRGGQIAVSSGQTLARFSVPDRALEQDTVIRMAVYGEGPATLVRFAPSGLRFLKNASLAVSFPSEGVDVASLGGYLIDANGSATPVPCTVEVRGGRIIVEMSIAHFSIYSPSDGDED